MKIQVSDVHRTVIDLLNSQPTAGDPSRCRLSTAYFSSRLQYRHSLSYAERFGNGAVFKRLGFLAETLGASPELVEACAAHLTEGIGKLDPRCLPSSHQDTGAFGCPSVELGRRKLIDRGEILAVATDLGLAPEIVEKDYFWAGSSGYLHHQH